MWNIATITPLLAPVWTRIRAFRIRISRFGVSAHGGCLPEGGGGQLPNPPCLFVNGQGRLEGPGSVVQASRGFTGVQACRPRRASSDFEPPPGDSPIHLLRGPKGLVTHIAPSDNKETKARRRPGSCRQGRRAYAAARQAFGSVSGVLLAARYASRAVVEAARTRERKSSGISCSDLHGAFARSWHRAGRPDSVPSADAPSQKSAPVAPPPGLEHQLLGAPSDLGCNRSRAHPRSTLSEGLTWL